MRSGSGYMKSRYSSRFVPTITGTRFQPSSVAARLEGTLRQHRTVGENKRHPDHAPRFGCIGGKDLRWGLAAQVGGDFG